MPPRKTARVIRPSPAATPLPEIPFVDYTITIEVKHKGPTMWIKMGARANVPEGGNPKRSQKALAAWIEKLAQEKIEEMLS